MDDPGSIRSRSIPGIASDICLKQLLFKLIEALSPELGCRTHGQTDCKLTAGFRAALTEGSQLSSYIFWIIYKEPTLVMSIPHYCYYCGRSHPEEDMRLIVTKNGKRWRCTRTILAGKLTTEERDRFGKLVSARNAEITSESKRKRASYEF